MPLGDVLAFSDLALALSLSLLPPQMAGIISCTHPPAPGTDNACVAMLCDSVVESVGMVGMGWVTFLIWQVALFGRWPGSHLPCRSAVLKETDSIIHLYSDRIGIYVTRPPLTFTARVGRYDQDVKLHS